MKSPLPFITKEDGFILIHVLFVISLTIILVTSAIATYRNEIFITNTQIEQIKAETLFQMGQAKYKEELLTSPSPINKAKYNFPDGIVDISIVEVNEKDNYIKLQFVINFYNRKVFSFRHLLAYHFS